MANFSILDNFQPLVEEDKLNKAKSYAKKLHKKVIKPVAIVEEIIKSSNGKKLFEITGTKDINELKNLALKKGQKVILDFGDHYVGHLKIKFKHKGSHPDAPAFIKMKMGEIIDELVTSSENYDGWISKGWIQEEWFHIDTFPKEVNMERRYAFRYLQVDVLATSEKYGVVIDEIELEAQSWIDFDLNPKLNKITDPELVKLDQIGLKTLRDSMQDVYEDGPKRDRRLWLGDLRLQALTNYYSFKDLDLVKKCLYLFSGTKFENKSVGACLFIEPEIEVDDTYLVDYSLLFISTLFDYYHQTKDMVILKDLWQVALDQIKTSQLLLSSENVTKGNNKDFWAFIDWNEELEKNPAVHGVYIFAYKHALELAKILDDQESILMIENYIKVLTDAAVKNYWSEKDGLFVSGENKQISYHSQVWLVLANIFDKKKNQQILKKLITTNPKVRLKTPYAYHYFIEALFENDLRDEGLKILKYYWGEMVNLGADTYWELFDPEDPFYSPYGSSIVNSYCHAWSCAPTYFIRKYLDI